MAKRQSDLRITIPSKPPGYKAIPDDDDYTLTEKVLIGIIKKEYEEFRKFGCDGTVIYTIANSLMYNKQYPTYENIRNIIFNKLIPIDYNAMNKQVKKVEKLEEELNQLHVRNSMGIGGVTDIQVCKLGERVANEKDKLTGAITSYKYLNALINKLTVREINAICTKYDIEN